MFHCIVLWVCLTHRMKSIADINTCSLLCSFLTMSVILKSENKGVEEERGEGNEGTALSVPEGINESVISLNLDRKSGSVRDMKRQELN